MSKHLRMLSLMALISIVLFAPLSADEIDDSVKRLNLFLEDLPSVIAERRGDTVVIKGWTRDEREQNILTKILENEKDVLDLTGSDIAEGNRMVQIDVVIVVVSETVAQSIGFDFLNLVNVQYDFFATRHHRDGIGFQAPGQIGAVSRRTQWGELFNAKVDYNVTIANADKQQVQIIARPHLTTLNGQRAEFLAGGEIVFQVSGIETGDIRPYPFGIELNVTPTILRTPGPNGETQVLLDVEASRISILGRLLTGEGAPGADDVNFDKTRVKSTTLLGMDETLILSGLYQREYRVRFSGVPILRKIPVLNLLFSNKAEVDDVLSTIIFITPREPAKVDQQLQDDIQAFIQRRIAYMRAREEGPEAIEKFKEDYPDWYQPQNNRYATHFSLVNNSRMYRELRGEDLRAEKLRRNLLGVESAEEAAEKRKKKFDFPI